MSLQYRKTLTVSASDADGVAATQKPLGAGNLILVSSTVTVPNGGQYLSISSDGNDSTRTFVITGTDKRGNTQTWTGAGPNATTEEIALPFATVTNVSISAAAVGNLTVGWVAKSLSDPMPLDMYSVPFNVSLTLENFTGSGTPEASVWFTQDNVFLPAAPNPSTNEYLAPSDYVWFEHPSLIAQTAAGTGNYAFPVIATAIYLDGNDQAASVDFIVLQSQSR